MNKSRTCTQYPKEWIKTWSQKQAISSLHRSKGIDLGVEILMILLMDRTSLNKRSFQILRK